MVLLTWIGIVLCLSQSATFSGLNLAFFTLSKLELEMASAKGDPAARRVLALRNDANFLLVTILWGNVAVNVLLALLSGSVLTGALAFLFSTVLITICGEILPQAWFARHALRVASRFAPLLRGYQLLLFPVAKPTALLLDTWLGPEAIPYFREKDLRELIRFHMESSATEIQKVEGQGALNFLALDDLPLRREGEPVDPHSVIALPFADRRPVFPEIGSSVADEFLQRVHRSGKKWVVITDPDREPRLVVDSDEFLRDALFHAEGFRPERHLHRPIIVRDGRTRVGDILGALQVKPQHGEDDVLDRDVILLWGDECRIITGADVLGRLLRGIVQLESRTGAA